MLRTAVIIAFITLSPVVAGAEPCGKRGDFIEFFLTKYDESPVSIGLISDGKVLEILASDRGTWSMIITAPSGETCGVAAGEAWSTMARAQDATSRHRSAIAGTQPRVHQHHHKP